MPRVIVGLIVALAIIAGVFLLFFVEKDAQNESMSEVSQKVIYSVYELDESDQEGPRRPREFRLMSYDGNTEEKEIIIRTHLQDKPYLELTPDKKFILSDDGKNIFAYNIQQQKFLRIWSTRGVTNFHLKDNVLVMGGLPINCTEEILPCILNTTERDTSWIYYKTDPAATNFGWNDIAGSGIANMGDFDFGTDYYVKDLFLYSISSCISSFSRCDENINYYKLGEGEPFRVRRVPISTNSIVHDEPVTLQKEGALVIIKEWGDWTKKHTLSFLGGSEFLRESILEDEYVGVLTYENFALKKGRNVLTGKDDLFINNGLIDSGDIIELIYVGN